jgi:hypothetical protein
MRWRAIAIIVSIAFSDVMAFAIAIAIGDNDLPATFGAISKRTEAY